jgi:hypothetical protein
LIRQVIIKLRHFTLAKFQPNDAFKTAVSSVISLMV